MDTNKTLVVSIPTGGSVDWRFCSSLMALRCPSNTKVIWQVKTMIDTARNNIVRLFLEDEGDFLLMIDDDMVFPYYTALQLMSHDVDVVGCLAFKRRQDYDPCVYKKIDGKYHPIIPEVFQEVDAIGSSGLLIKREVLEKLQHPYFETGYDKEGIRFTEGNHFSVDFDFSVKAIEAGFKIFCDPTVEFGHIGDSPVINRETFLKHIEKIHGKEEGTDSGSIQPISNS